MVELLAKFKTKIDFRLFKDEWVRPFGYNFNNDKELKLINNNLSSEYYAYTPILEIGKRYLIKYEIKNFKETGPDKWVQISCGFNNGPKRFNNGKYEDYIDCNVNNNFGIRWIGYTTATISYIYIEEVGFTSLDCDEETSIQINLGVNEIRAISEKISNYSNEILLPGTSKNNKFFKYVFDVNTQNIFNINIKTPAILKIDGIEFKEGYIKLERIIKNNSLIDYEVVFYGETANLFADTKNFYLKDLDFSDLNHSATTSIITTSWEGHLPFVYPYICYGDEPLRGSVGSALDKQKIINNVVIPAGLGLTVADLYPAIQVKYLIDKIFNTFGYTYKSNIFYSDWFSKIYMPFTNDEEILSSYYKVARLNFGTPKSISYWTCRNFGILPFVNYQTGKYLNDVKIIANADGIPSKFPSMPGLTSINFTTPINLYRRVNTDYELMIDAYLIQTGGLMPSLITGPQYLNNIIPGCYVTRKSGKHKLKMRYRINMMFGNHPIKVFITRIPRSAIYETGTFTSGGVSHKYYKVNDETTELVDIVYTTSTNFREIEKEIYCEKDDNIGFKFVPDPNSWNFPDYHEYWEGVIDYIEIEEYGFGKNCYVDFKNVVPQEMKINDFITSLINMFNLYIEETDIHKQLNIQTYKDYYELGTTKDFTYKIDNNNNQEIEFPAEFFTKNILFKYKDVDDTWNNYYRDFKDNKNLPVGYGGLRITTDNEFNDNEKTIQNNFAPTVLRSYWVRGETIPDASRISFSSIENYDYNDNGVVRQRKTKTHPRILFYNKQNFFDNPPGPNQFEFRFENNSYNFYPYIGHILYPYDMNNTTTELLDLNYDTSLINEEGSWSLMFNGFPVGYVTKKNLYNLFWGDYINNHITKDSRILIAKFKLNKKDILNLKMNDKIILNNTNYIINKINNLDLECRNLTEIELLKIDDIKFNYSSGVSSILGGSINPINPDNFVLGNNNSIAPGTSGNIILGSNNILPQTTSERRPTFIVGDNNIIIGGTAIGNNNQQQTRSIILGEDNIISREATTSIIIGNSQNINNRGVIIDNKLNDENIENLNDEGLNTVGEMFYNQEINDAGENKLWDLTYFDNNIIEDGGEN